MVVRTNSGGKVRVLDKLGRESSWVCFFVLCNRHRFNRVPGQPGGWAGPDGGAFTVFESGTILLYLGEKVDAFLGGPLDRQVRADPAQDRFRCVQGARQLRSPGESHSISFFLY